MVDNNNYNHNYNGKLLKWGYLSKQTKDFTGRWQKKWFEFYENGNFFYYIKDPQDDSRGTKKDKKNLPKGIPLQQDTRVMAAFFTTNKPYNIRIETRFGAFTLQASSSEEMNDWVRELNQSIKTLKIRGGPSPFVDTMVMASPDPDRNKAKSPYNSVQIPREDDNEDEYDTEMSLPRKRHHKTRKEKVDPSDEITRTLSTDTSTDITNISMSTTSTSMDKRVWICCLSVESVGEDFVEIGIREDTIEELKAAIANELEVPVDAILKIRKPVTRILIRKDSDVEKLLDQEKLEIILKEEVE